MRSWALQFCLEPRGRKPLTRRQPSLPQLPHRWPFQYRLAVRGSMRPSVRSKQQRGICATPATIFAGTSGRPWKRRTMRSKSCGPPKLAIRVGKWRIARPPFLGPPFFLGSSADERGSAVRLLNVFPADRARPNATSANNPLYVQLPKVGVFNKGGWTFRSDNSQSLQWRATRAGAGPAANEHLRS